MHMFFTSKANRQQSVLMSAHHGQFQEKERTTSELKFYYAEKFQKTKFKFNNHIRKRRLGFSVELMFVTNKASSFEK